MVVPRGGGPGRTEARALRSLACGETSRFCGGIKVVAHWGKQGSSKILALDMIQSGWQVSGVVGGSKLEMNPTWEWLQSLSLSLSAVLPLLLEGYC